MIRLHVTAPLADGHAVAPTLDQSRYLTQVMRLKQGDTLLLFNGEHGEWRAEIIEVLKKGVILRCVEQTREQAFGPDLELILSGIKKARVETVAEKATELGARTVQLTITQRTNAERIRLDRLDAIVEEAAEQSERLDVPVVHESKKLADILANWPQGRLLMFCDETGGAPAFEALQKAAAQNPSAPWSILIGPEGGFSPEEREQLRALPFTTAVSLGPRILRADTAAIAAMTLWQSAVGDWER